MASHEAIKLPGPFVVLDHKIPDVAGIAVTCLLPFGTVQRLVENSPAPARPNRVQLLRPGDDEDLKNEFDAWDAASDETLERFENEVGGSDQ